jgi:hypothetical protein
MSLAEIEAAAEALPPAEKEELLRFLAKRLRQVKKPAARGARLVSGPNGMLLLEAAPGAPPMTTETVRRMLEDFP